jgi:1-acyl-sn-glycerol-3-phosphate acyltransferase
MSAPAGVLPGSGPPGFRPLVYDFSKQMLLWWARLWLRLTIEGRQHVPPTGPLLAIGNHCSYIDPPLLGVGIARPVRYLAQQGLAKFPPLRWWLAAVGVSLIDRNAPSKDVLRALSTALEAGAVVGLFPEGTRSSDGRIGSFRNGVEFLVRRTGATVLPIGIEGAFAAYRRGMWVPRPRKCRVRIGAPWASERVLAPGGVEALRREVAALARAELRPEAAAQPPRETRVDHGPGPVPADPPPSAGGRA